MKDPKKEGKKERQPSSTTTLQVHKSLKNELDLLKIMLGHDDLNALLNELKEHYISSKKVTIDPATEKFLRKIRK